jgi:hypothetical protein
MRERRVGEIDRTKRFRKKKLNAEATEVAQS